MLTQDAWYIAYRDIRLSSLLTLVLEGLSDIEADLEQSLLVHERDPGTLPHVLDSDAAHRGGPVHGLIPDPAE